MIRPLEPVGPIKNGELEGLPNSSILWLSLGDLDQRARQQGDILEHRAIALEGDLVLCTAFHILEEEIGRAPSCKSRSSSMFWVRRKSKPR